MNLSELNDAQLVDVYVKLRDRRADRKSAYQLSDAEDDRNQDKIEAILLSRMAESGNESVRTKFGTASKSVKSTVSVADKEIFLNFVKTNEEWSLLTVAAAKDAVKQFKEAHEDLPPGLNWREELSISIRRA